MYQRTATDAANTLRAIRAIGTIVQIEPNTFLAILDKLESPLVVMSLSKTLFSQTHQYRYMTNYKGFILFTEAKQPLQLQHKIELIEAESIWLPSVQNVSYYTILDPRAII